MLAATVTGLPSFLPGENFHFFTASIAVLIQAEAQTVQHADVADPQLMPTNSQCGVAGCLDHVDLAVIAGCKVPTIRR